MCKQRLADGKRWGERLDTNSCQRPLSQTQRAFPKEHRDDVASNTKLPFTSAPNKFEAMASHDVMVKNLRDVEYHRREPE
jgi:hypothetical protein